MKSALAFVILILSSFSALATVYHSDGSEVNVELIHDTQAVNGDTITLPAGTFTWLIPVTISKAIKIQGEGSVESSDGAEAISPLGLALRHSPSKADSQPQ